MTPDFHSSRLGSISPSQFQQALDRFDLGTFVKAEPIPYGLFGQNGFLTSTRGEFVLRGAPHYPWQFPTEQFFTHLLHQRTGVPVPYPYWLEDDKTVFGWEYVIMPRMPGLTLQDPAVKERLSHADRLEIARAVADTLMDIRTLTWEVCGRYQPETKRVEPFERPYRHTIVQHIYEKFEDACRCNDHTTRSDRQFVEAVVKQAEGVLDLPFQPAMVCGDFGEHNLLVEQRDQAWRVSAVFDLMTAHFGDGAADLSCPVMGYLKEDETLADAFVEEYRAKTAFVAGFAELQQLYMLDLALSFWRYFQKYAGGMPEDAGKTWSFEHWAHPLIAYWAKYS